MEVSVGSITILPPGGMPEVNLWIAKINRHLFDLASTSKCDEKVRAKKQAYEFFYRDQDQLEMVCDAAGYPVEYVLRAADSVVKHGIHWIAEPGKGKHYERNKKYRPLPGMRKKAIIQTETQTEKESV